jgi:hypothetical protein
VTRSRRIGRCHADNSTSSAWGRRAGVGERLTLREISQRVAQVVAARCAPTSALFLDRVRNVTAQQVERASCGSCLGRSADAQDRTRVRARSSASFTLARAARRHRRAPPRASRASSSMRREMIRFVRGARLTVGATIASSMIRALQSRSLLRVHLRGREVGQCSMRPAGGGTERLATKSSAARVYSVRARANRPRSATNLRRAHRCRAPRTGDRPPMPRLQMSIA